TQADTAGAADLIVKQSGVLAGLQVFERVFTLLDSGAVFETAFQDGDEVNAGVLAGRLTGNMRALLSGERTALNFLQRMSGIATLTRRCADILRGCRTKLVDTRKTTPGLRILEKYAVKAGGAENHRYNLSDAVLLKDNHISAAGGVKNAIDKARKYTPFVCKIEVEAETLEMVKEAVDAGADVIMLDNMDNAAMKEAVRLIGGRAKTECSGNVTEERLREIAEIGLDFVSSGALTHSCGIMDISMKNLRPLG
ncbi:MAG: carboxylating nicotinate-nucleotide diphosphorylase, partial [Synergistaceae bacterium]|nr:carboxylating nicotinate-nucleotide diphosphorylase [Synergistaceae bacterium]